MAKKFKIPKNNQRRDVVERYALRRAAIKAVLSSPSGPLDEKALAAAALHRMPRDASPTRLRNRDAVDARPRGHLRKFELSRIQMREMAHRGELPGITKPSW